MKLDQGPMSINNSAGPEFTCDLIKDLWPDGGGGHAARGLPGPH